MPMPIPMPILDHGHVQDQKSGESHVCGLLNRRSPAAVTCKIFAFCRMTIKCLNEWHNTRSGRDDRRSTIDDRRSLDPLLVIDHRGIYILESKL